MRGTVRRDKRSWPSARITEHPPNGKARMTMTEIPKTDAMNVSSFRLRVFLRASALVLRHFLGTLALYWNRFTEFINSDQSEDAVCNATLFARHVTRDPNLDWNGH